MLQFTKEDKATKKMINYQDHAVLCTDLNGFIDYIIEERELNQENILIRIGMDGGGGFMKVCLS